MKNGSRILVTASLVFSMVAGCRAPVYAGDFSAEIPADAQAEDVQLINAQGQGEETQDLVTGVQTEETGKLPDGQTIEDAGEGQTTDPSVSGGEAANGQETTADSTDAGIPAETEAVQEQAEEETAAAEDTAADPVAVFVTHLYQAMLNREPDAGGLADWVHALRNGKTGAEVARGFYYSREFQNLGLNDADFVTRMYRAMLGREPDAAGLANWVNILKNGCTRDFIFQGFVGSPEFSALCKKGGFGPGTFVSSSVRDKNPGVTAFVARMYTTVLGRNFDDSGLSGWISRLLEGKTGGVETVKGFFNSREFTNKHLGNDGFLTTAYRAILNREPDASGWRTWMTKLNSGTSRESVLEGLMDSAEFRNLCTSLGIKHDIPVDYYYQRAQSEGSATNYLILVDKTTHVLVLYHRENGKWKEVLRSRITDGAPGMRTPNGHFRTGIKQRYFDGADYRCWYATQITGSYLMHSVLYYKDPTPSRVKDGVLGVQASHGCVRCELFACKYIYDHVPGGTTIDIYNR